MSEVREYIIDYLQREYSLPEDVDYETFDFVEKGYIDSMAMIQFIVLLEDEFGISFSDDELTDRRFRTIGGLTKIVEKKIAENGNE